MNTVPLISDQVFTRVQKYSRFSTASLNLIKPHFKSNTPLGAYMDTRALLFEQHCAGWEIEKCETSNKKLAWPSWHRLVVRKDPGPFRLHMNPSHVVIH